MRHAFSSGYNHTAALSPWEQYILYPFRHASVIQLLELEESIYREANTGWVWGHLNGHSCEQVKGSVTVIKRYILLIQFLTMPDTNNLIVNIEV